MKIRTGIRMIILTAVSGLLLAGCTSPGRYTGGGNEPVSTTEPYNVAFVVAIANNNPIVDVNRVDEYTSLTDCPGATYSFVEADSTPHVILDGTILDYTSKGYSKPMIERISSSVRMDLEQQLADAQPDAPGVDLVKGIELASRTLHSSEKRGRRNILVIYASGINDTGLLNMVECPLCDLDVKESVSDLSDHLELNLEKIDIVWYCAGDVAGDQGELNSVEREKLTTLYEGLFSASHAQSVVFREDLPPAGHYSFSQHVAVMRTEGEHSVLNPVIHYSTDLSGINDTSQAFFQGDMISFDEKQLAFRPDSVELKDPETALQTLDYVLAYMSEQKDFDLLILGTTSSYGDNEEESRIFSEKRAASIMKLLAANGVDQNHLFCLGCGYSVSELFTPDRNEDGSLNEALASQNRRVYLLDRNSDTAKQILQQMCE